MIEHEVGEATFQAAIRSYLAAHADGNATAADVFAAIDRAAGKPLGRARHRLLRSGRGCRTSR